MEKLSGKKIIFMMSDVGKSDNKVKGWTPYSKTVKMCILDYLEQHYSRPANRATSANEVFSILADWEEFYSARNQLDDEGYFFKTHQSFLNEWGITKDVVISSTKILADMGWINKKNENEHRNGHPQRTPYYKLNHDKIIQDIRNKYPKLYKLF